MDSRRDWTDHTTYDLCFKWVQILLLRSLELMTRTVRMLAWVRIPLPIHSIVLIGSNMRGVCSERKVMLGGLGPCQ